MLVRDYHAGRYEEAGATAGGALYRDDGGKGYTNHIFECWRRLEKRGTGIGATGGRVAGTRAGTNSSWGAPAGVSDTPGSEKALEEDAGGAVSGDNHCTASTARRTTLTPPQTRVHGTRVCAALASGTESGADGWTPPPCSYPQRQRRTRFGTCRLQQGQIHTNEPPVACCDMVILTSVRSVHWAVGSWGCAPGSVTLRATHIVARTASA